MKVLSIWELILALIIIPLMWPFPLWALVAAAQGDSIFIALAGSYIIGIPSIIFMALTMPSRYWTSKDCDSACEGTPEGN